MTQKTRKNLLGIYDLLLAAGAIFTGIMMIQSNYGVFTQYPKEWLSILPFESWFLPGILAILIFGLGNIISALVVFRKSSNTSWKMSALMGVIFFMSIVAQRLILGEWYMATVQFLILSIIQLSLSGFVFLSDQKK
jgi:hypothetical protein